MNLTPTQQQLVKECLKKGNGCLAVPMGMGKTRMALALSASLRTKPSDKTLVVADKSLVSSWMTEIKAYDPQLAYTVYSSGKDPPETANTIIITPTALSRAYKNFNIESQFVISVPNENGLGSFNSYELRDRPFLAHKDRVSSYLYYDRWKCLIVDEIQKHNTISTNKCRAICTICADHRWGLSGTVFDDVNTSRILGYHLMLGIHSFPNNLPDAEQFIRRPDFKGINHTLVERKEPDYIVPESTSLVVQHDLSENELTLYHSLRTVMKSIKESLNQFKLANDTEMVRKYNAYLLGLITYVRQFLVCPLLPFTNMMVEINLLKNKNDIFNAIKGTIDTLNLEDWLNTTDSCKSTRIVELLRIADSHRDEKMIVFTCFRQNLNVIAHYLKEENHIVFTLESSYSISKRTRELDRFKTSETGVLLLTYQIGAEGLNLQHCRIALFTDFWWNSAKTKQALARILRRGQTQRVISYFFTSNTGIERCVFNKHLTKNQVIDELMVGQMITAVSKLSIKDMVETITADENGSMIKRIH